MPYGIRKELLSVLFKNQEQDKLKEDITMMHDMGMMGMSYGMGIFGGLIQILVIVVLILLAIYLYKKITEKTRRS